MRSNDLADRVALAQLQKGSDKIGEIELKLKRYLCSASNQNYHTSLRSPLNIEPRKSMDLSFYRHPLSTDKPTVNRSNLYSHDRLRGSIERHMLYNYNLQAKDMDYHPSLQKPKFGLDNLPMNPLATAARRRESNLNSSSIDLSLWRTKSQDKSFLVPPRLPTASSVDYTNNNNVNKTTFSALNALSTSLETRKIKKLKTRPKAPKSKANRSLSRKSVHKSTLHDKKGCCCAARRTSKKKTARCLRTEQEKENCFSFCGWPQQQAKNCCKEALRKTKKTLASSTRDNSTTGRRSCLSGTRKPLLPCRG